MKLKKSDGGRHLYYRGETNDCVIRAICNATGRDYKIVYDDLYKLQGYSPRSGVNPKIAKNYIEKLLGLKWHSFMNIGTGCTIHLKSDELPKGVLIVRLSKHLTCVINGVLYDTYDCSRNGTRCVYGYWSYD